jgi:2-hydroxychromene-2-carboxylate isomerase
LKQIDWYFDFISPFAYLASESLWRFPPQIELRPRPVLFAAILNHWQTLGPAEIPPMRRFTFRHIRWLADSNEIALTLPPAHPFNPLKLLRLSVALGNEIEAVQRLFRFVWAEGCSADDPGQWQRLLEELGMQEAQGERRVGNRNGRVRGSRFRAGWRGFLGLRLDRFPARLRRGSRIARVTANAGRGQHARGTAASAVIAAGLEASPDR